MTTTPAQSAPVTDHELWYRTCELVETTATDIEPRILLSVVDVIVSSGIARELLAAGRLPLLAAT